MEVNRPEDDRLFEMDEVVEILREKAVKASPRKIRRAIKRRRLDPPPLQTAHHFLFTGEHLRQLEALLPRLKQRHELKHSAAESIRRMRDFME